MPTSPVPVPHEVSRGRLAQALRTLARGHRRRADGIAPQPAPRLSRRPAWLRHASALSLAVLLAACGGGTGTADGNAAPVARAGSDRSVALGATVTLDGSASSDVDGDPVSYQWAMVDKPAGSAAALARPSDATPSFEPDMAGTYRLRLVVSDGKGASVNDEVVVTVAAANAAPQAVAGVNRSVVTGTSVQLDGSGSSDPNGDTLTFQWALTTRPGGSNAALSSASAAGPGFVPDRDGDYVVTLVVSDGPLSSPPSTVLVKAGPANVAPVADAGPNQNVLVNSLVLLNGAQSTDANGNALTWRWFLTSRPAGSQAVLSAAQSAQPSFAADAAGDYVVTLIVNDGQLDSAPDTLVVNAASGNVKPVAVPGPGQTVKPGSTVQLDGSASTDANGDALTYAWTLTARPAGSAAALADGGTARPSFTADVAGDYVLRLIVNDGKVASEPQSLLVRAAAANAPPVADAGPAQTVGQGATVTLDASRSADADGAIVSRMWTLTGRPAGSTATLSSPTAEKPTFVADRAGSFVAALVVSDGQADSAASSVTITVLPASAPQIVLGAAEPLSGTVPVSLTSTASGAVTWYLNLKLLGTGATTQGNVYNWNTAGTPNGSQLLLARIQAGDGSFYEVRRTVQVANSTVNLSASASGTTGQIGVLATASSTFGIVGVTARLGQTNLGTLTQPNACSGRTCTTFNAYRFALDGVALGSGSYTVVVSATDGAGSTREVNVPVSVSNPPTLQLNAPADGAIVFGQLQVSGTTSTDKAGAVTVTARLGDVEILNTTQANFGTSYSLAGLSPGSYTLTVRAADNTNTITQIQRNVVVSSQAGLALQPVSTLAEGAQVLAAEGSKLLLRTADQALQVRDLAFGTVTALQSAAAIQNAAGWQFGGGGSVVAYGKDADCVLYCIYRWDAAGTRANLTNPNPHSRATNIGGGWAYDLHPVARDGHVVWVNDKAADTGVVTSATGRYTVFNVGAGTYTRVGVPAGVAYVGNNSYDFAVVGGVVRFWFWGQTGGEGMSSTFDIFEWRSDTNTTTRITQAGVRSVYVQTDGVRAAWQQSPVGGSTDNTYTLVQRSLAGGAASAAVAGQVSQSQLRDGVLAWVESTATSRALRAATTAQTTTLSVLSTANLLAVGEGAVVYSEQGKLYLWKAASPAGARLLLDATPSGVWIAGGHVVFTLGTGIHRVSL
jgi:hypothetical protein